MLCLVGDVAAEVPTDNAVPGGVILLVKFLKKIKIEKSVKKKAESKCRTNDSNLQILPHISLPVCNVAFSAITN